MKNSYGIYYLIIVFLIIMMLVPPLFRVLIPKEETAVKQPTHTINKLTCNQTKIIGNKNVTMVVTTTYLDTTLASIKLAHTKIENENVSDPFITNFNSLKSVTNVKYDETDNSILFNYINFDFSKEASLSIYSKDINTQKHYYESQGFSCQVTNN